MIESLLLDVYKRQIQYHSVCMGNIFQNGFVYLFQAIDVVLGTLQYIRGIFFQILGHNDLQSSFDYVSVDVLAHYHRISIEMYNPLFGTMDAERLTAESLYTAILVDLSLIHI